MVTKAAYGSHKALRNKSQSEEATDELISEIIDVTVPLNFLVNEPGQLKVCFLYELFEQGYVEVSFSGSILIFAC